MSLAVAFETGRLYDPLRDIADGKGDVYTAFTLLPGLRGFWPMSAIDNTGNPINLAGNEALSRVGNPTYDQTNSMPFMAFNGSTDYLSHNDAATFDITATESYIDATRLGITLGGWFWHEGLSGGQAYISKYGDSGNLSYMLLKASTGQHRFVISDNGTTVYGVDGSMAQAGVWTFLAARFEPSSHLSIFANETKAAFTTVAVSIYNSTASFRVGGSDGFVLRPLNGRASLCFLCAQALPDNVINGLYQVSRDLFGV